MFLQIFNANIFGIQADILCPFVFRDITAFQNRILEYSGFWYAESVSPTLYYYFLLRVDFSSSLTTKLLDYRKSSNSPS